MPQLLITVPQSSHEVLLNSHIKRRWSRDLYSKARLVADEMGWAKTYDAEYVALARTLGVPLLTRDARLRRAAGRLVEIVTPDDLD